MQTQSKVVLAPGVRGFVLSVKVNGIPVPLERSKIEFTQDRNEVRLRLMIARDDALRLRSECISNDRVRIELGLPGGISTHLIGHHYVIPEQDWSGAILYHFEWLLMLPSDPETFARVNVFKGESQPL